MKTIFIMKNLAFHLNRFIFLALLVLGLLTMKCNSPEPPKKKKPNLLFIWTDEQRANTMSAYGNNIIKTPNLNKLAEEGIVFKNAYVTQPVCTPSRSSVMTGLYPHTNGCVANNIPLNKSIQTFPLLLQDSDYQTAYMGKWHLGNEIFAQQGFNQWISIEDEYSNYYSADRDKNSKSSYYHWLIEKGYLADGKNNSFSRSFAVSLPIENCKPAFLSEQACNYLEENRGNPFILYVNFLEPHMPFNGPLDSLYSPGEVTIPPNLQDLLDHNDPLRYRLKREYCMQKYGDTEAEMRQLIARYWGLVSQVDLSVGKILNKLKELGLDENTIVVFTSDHGDMMGAHFMVEKQVMFEDAVKVPFLLKIPFLKDVQKQISQRISQIDLVPTLLDLMGGKVPENLQGKSLVPLISGKEVKEDCIFIEWNPDRNYRNGINDDTKMASEEDIQRVGTSSSRAVITQDGWKLCLSEKDKSQLYNLNNDPYETTNLFPDPQFSVIIKELSLKIREWQIKTDDKLELK